MKLYRNKSIQEHISKSPPELVEHFKERYKDVPCKGDVLVRVGHASIVGDLQRLFANDKIRGPLSLDIGNTKLMKVYRTIFRLLAVPGVVLGGIHAKLFRANHYNPFTNTVHIFHPNQRLGCMKLTCRIFLIRNDYDHYCTYFFLRFPLLNHLLNTKHLR